MPVDTYILDGEHLAVIGNCPAHWRPELPIEVRDPWLNKWFTVTSIAYGNGTYLFILDGNNVLRTQNLKRLSVRIKV